MTISTPLARRRLNNFKANRRGYYSLWVFLDTVRRSPCSPS